MNTKWEDVIEFISFESGEDLYLPEDEGKTVVLKMIDKVTGQKFAEKAHCMNGHIYHMRRGKYIPLDPKDKKDLFCGYWRIWKLL